MWEKTVQNSTVLFRAVWWEIIVRHSNGRALCYVCANKSPKVLHQPVLWSSGHPGWASREEITRRRVISICAAQTFFPPVGKKSFFSSASPKWRFTCEWPDRICWDELKELHRQRYLCLVWQSTLRISCRQALVNPIYLYRFQSASPTDAEGTLILGIQHPPLQACRLPKEQRCTNVQVSMVVGSVFNLLLPVKR